jgi:hypothetical protein
LLVVVALTATGMAALRLGGLLAELFRWAVFLLVVAMTIRAVVLRGASQAFAAGFVIVVGAYVALFLATNTSGSELDGYSGRLPTTKAGGWLFERVVRREYTDLATGKVTLTPPPKNTGLPNGGTWGGSANISGIVPMGGMGGGMGGTPSGFGSGVGGGMGGFGGIAGMGGPGYYVQEYPERTDYFLTAHTLIALFTAALGGWYGAALFAWRERQTAPAVPPPTSSPPAA